MTIVLRSEKGTPLTSNEVDGNFIDLDGRVSTAKQRADDAHTLAGQAKTVADAAQVKLVAGANITIDVTDPTAPVISASGGGAGNVQTVAGVAPQNGDVPVNLLSDALSLGSKLDVSQKGVVNGVASLDGGGKVPSAQLPSYVDDVLEFFTLAAMPRPGETGKIYIALNTNRQYRWPQDGSDYVELVASPGTTDAIVEGSVNKWWTNARTLASTLGGLSFSVGTAITAADTVLSAFGKLQKQVSDVVMTLAGKLGTNDKAADSDKLNGQTASFYTATMGPASDTVAGSKGLVAAPAAGGTRFWSSLGTWLTVTASASWGNITGTLANQTDLKAALDDTKMKRWRSGNLSVSGSVTNLAHGLGQTPDDGTIFVTLTAATGGWPIGSIFRFSICNPNFGGNGSYYGVMVANLTSSTYSINCGSTGIILNTTAGASVYLLPANCTIQLELFAWN